MAECGRVLVDLRDSAAVLPVEGDTSGPHVRVKEATRLCPRARCDCDQAGKIVSITAAITDTATDVASTMTLRTYPIARNPDRVSRASRDPALVEPRLFREEVGARN